MKLQIALFKKVFVSSIALGTFSYASELAIPTFLELRSTFESASSKISNIDLGLYSCDQIIYAKEASSAKFNVTTSLKDGGIELRRRQNYADLYKNVGTDIEPLWEASGHSGVQAELYLKQVDNQTLVVETAMTDDAASVADDAYNCRIAKNCVVARSFSNPDKRVSSYHLCTAK